MSNGTKEPKRGILRFIKRRGSTTSTNAERPEDEVQLRQQPLPPPIQRPPQLMRIRSVQPSSPREIKETKHKRSSLGALHELIQCPLCLEKLINPKMLPCQHTFCIVCLFTQLQENTITCPMCSKTYMDMTSNALSMLPSNLYIDNLLKALGSSVPKEEESRFAFPPKIEQKRCRQCQSLIEVTKEHVCQHCKQNFCRICWEAHISELKSQIGSLLEQLKSGSQRLNHRFESYKDRNDWLVDNIKSTVEKKIFELQEKQQDLLDEAEQILKQGETSMGSLQGLLEKMQSDVNECVSKDFDNITNDHDKVKKFMQFHKTAIDLLSDVGHWGETKYSFDQEKFCIERDFELTEDAEADESTAIVEVRGIENPLESIEKMTLYYRSRNFTPRMIWKKSPRPAGVGVAPWSDNLYICSTDSHTVIVMDKNKGKIIERFSDSKILCPQSIAFSERREEIYVSDKWSHCIHVLSKNGNHKRTIGTKGTKEGGLRSPEGISVEPNENFLYVCDTGNDRVQVFDINNGAFVKFIGVFKRHGARASSDNFTQLMAPTDVVATSERIVVADSGNKRVKIYSYGGEKLREFGSHGSLKGQFRHPEALAVDPLGFIVVGDSGNARVQIFDANGHLVRVFGGRGKEPGRFGWISGVCITPQLEIVVCDTKNHQINIF